ncbi:type II secretion system protein [Fusobacterium sp. PH5-44]|uniref:type II secretion system protein n=1 Tax=unclassified Fusobacterium TaxID=2648384 RepID=UPI003D19BF1C
MYKCKNKGITLIESLISMAILGIVLMIISPIISIFNKTQMQLQAQSKYIKNIEKIVFLMEKNISNASLEEFHLSGEQYLSNGKGIYIYSQISDKNIDNSFLKNVKIRGNFLLLKISAFNKGKKFLKYIAFKFEEGYLSVINFALEDNILKKVREEKILSNVQGEFIMENDHIKIFLAQISNEKISKCINNIEGVGAIEKNFK